MARARTWVPPSAAAVRAASSAPAAARTVAHHGGAGSGVLRLHLAAGLLQPCPPDQRRQPAGSRAGRCSGPCARLLRPIGVADFPSGGAASSRLQHGVEPCAEPVANPVEVIRLCGPFSIVRRSMQQCFSGKLASCPESQIAFPAKGSSPSGQLQTAVVVKLVDTLSWGSGESCARFESMPTAPDCIRRRLLHEGLSAVRRQ